MRSFSHRFVACAQMPSKSLADRPVRQSERRFQFGRVDVRNSVARQTFAPADFPRREIAKAPFALRQWQSTKDWVSGSLVLGMSLSHSLSLF